MVFNTIGSLAILLVTSIIFFNVSFAQAETYKIAAPDSSTIEAISLFTTLVGEEVGNVQIENLTGIGNARELLPLVQHGVIDIAIVPFSAVRVLSNSQLLSPFLSSDAAGIRRAIDSEVGAYDKFLLERDGVRVLDFWHVASSILASSTRIDSVQDLNGRKVAISPAQNPELFANLGANAIQVPFSEIFTALQQGAIDTTPVPYNDLSPNLKFSEVAKTYVDRHYQPALYAVVVKKETWEDLNFLQQHSLSRAARETGEQLSVSVDYLAQAFKTNQLTHGAEFTTWGTKDVGTVLLANLQTSRSVDGNNGQRLTRIAFAVAAPIADRPTRDSVRLPQSTASIFFATDRSLVSGGSNETLFSAKRSLNKVEFGEAKLELKEGRRLGDDLEDATEVLKVDVFRNQASIKTMLQTLSMSGEPLVIFVHGYNNSFSDAIRRAATIRQDIAPNANVISYTWPSDGSLLGYGYDASSANVAYQNFHDFMDTLTSEISPDRIQIIAHSMGGRLLLNYLAELQIQKADPAKMKFKNIVFAAPDVAQDLFKQKVDGPRGDSSRKLTNYSNSITIYSSQYDRALGLSHEIHNDKRLGLSTDQSLFLDSGITSIDASPIDPARWYQRFSFATRHSYVFDKTLGVRDLAEVLAGVPPQNRGGLQIRQRNGQTYWQMTADN